MKKGYGGGHLQSSSLPVHLCSQTQPRMFNWPNLFLRAHSVMLPAELNGGETRCSSLLSYGAFLHKGVLTARRLTALPLTTVILNCSRLILMYAAVASSEKNGAQAGGGERLVSPDPPRTVETALSIKGSQIMLS